MPIGIHFRPGGRANSALFDGNVESFTADNLKGLFSKADNSETNRWDIMKMAPDRAIEFDLGSGGSIVAVRGLRWPTGIRGRCG